MNEDEARAFIRAFVRERAGIVLSEEKNYLVDTRLYPLVSRRALSLIVVAEELRNAPTGAIAQEVVESLTTNETSFFRDIHYFDALRDIVLPELFERRKLSGRLRVWCGAASTGQEPYSLAMLLADAGPAKVVDAKILATDLATNVLEYARVGSYTQREVNRGMPAMMLVRHFRSTAGRWAVVPAVKDLVEFKTRNLTQDWRSAERYDLVMLRNVLIYFDSLTREQILKRVHAQLTTDGYLMLGSAESAPNLSPDFKLERHGKAVFYRPIR